MMPAISQAQIAAVVGWIVAQAVAYGAIDNETSSVIISISATVVAAAWKIADAWRHKGNAYVKAAAIASANDTEKELQAVNSA